MKLSTLLLVLLPALIMVMSGCVGMSEQDAVANSNRCHANLDPGELQKALGDCDEAIRLDPQDAVTYYNRGGVYDDLGQPQRAIQDYDEAIRLDPQFGEAYALRAAAYTLLGRDAEAQNNVERAIELGIDPINLERFLEQLKKQR